MFPLTADGRLLLLTCTVRNVAFGFISVVLALYLGALGYDAAGIGVFFTLILIGGAVMTVLLTALADGVGRRRVLAGGGILMALASVVFVLTTQPLLLVLVAVAGSLSPNGRESGSFLATELAILPQATPPRSRTAVFAIYNLATTLGSALGALAAGIPAWLGLDPVPGYRLLILAYGAIGLLLWALFCRLSSAVEVPVTDVPRPRLTFQRPRPVVRKLAALFALDGFGGGLAGQGLTVYWLNLRFGADAATLGLIFFGTNLLAGLTSLAAVPLARRFGLIETLVFTQLPTNALAMLIPLMPNLELASAVVLGRSLLGQLDLPTRQAYTMAVVPPEERAAAAGFTAVSRNTASALGPALAGTMLANSALGLPFLISGGLKIIYDLAMLATFRKIRPPEEMPPQPALEPS
jgi:MFS family permease